MADFDGEVAAFFDGLRFEFGGLDAQAHCALPERGDVRRAAHRRAVRRQQLSVGGLTSGDARRITALKSGHETGVARLNCVVSGRHRLAPLVVLNQRL